MQATKTHHPQEFNEAVIDLFSRHTDNPGLVHHMYLEFQKQFPQLNYNTRVEMVYHGTARSMEVLIAGNRDVLSIKQHWYPAAGIKALYLRLVKRFHKWLVDNRYHPADRPPNWRPLNVDHVGMIDISPDQYFRPAGRIEIEFKHFTYGWPQPGPAGFLYNQMEYLDLMCAYDALSDTLYIRRS